jgi:ferredoxin-NADP reductase
MTSSVHARKSIGTHGEAERTLVVAQAELTSTDVLMLRLQDPEGAELPEWEPGAHVDVTVEGITRQYSLCGDPGDRTNWRIAVLRDPNGQGGSQLIHGRARTGLRVLTRGPRNHFALHPAPQYLFIAGGIGITPLLPMIATVERSSVPWRLVYAVRTLDRFAFLPDLVQYGDKVTYQVDETDGLLDLGRLVTEAAENAGLYACGPSGLLDTLEELCTAAGRSLRIERFTADAKALEAATNGGAFELVAQASGITVEVPAGTTTLRALRDAGIDVLTSCEEGVCGTCETRVLAGIPAHHDSVLDDEERARNDVMMVCVSRAATPSITLDI